MLFNTTEETKYDHFELHKNITTHNCGLIFTQGKLPLQL